VISSVEVPLLLLMGAARESQARVRVRSMRDIVVGIQPNRLPFRTPSDSYAGHRLRRYSGSEAVAHRERSVGIVFLICSLQGHEGCKPGSEQAGCK